MSNSAPETVLIFPHLAYHGIGFFKQVLAAYYSGKWKVQDSRTASDLLNQQALEQVFDDPAKKGFLFDQVYYLTLSQQILDTFTTRRWSSLSAEVKEDPIIPGSGTLPLWEAVKARHEQAYQAGQNPSLEEDYQANWATDASPALLEAFRSQFWQNIQHYPVQEQVKWFFAHANSRPWYDSKRVSIQNLGSIKDLHDGVAIASALYQQMQEIRKKHSHPDTRFVIHTQFTGWEVIVAWHVLAEAGYLPPNTEFILAYDDKATLRRRLRDIQIVRKPTNLIGEVRKSLAPPLYLNPASRSRKIAQKRLESYVGRGFSILLLGERGTGKSSYAKEAAETHDKKHFFAANCASFDDDSKAESELFGHTKNAFTGANTEKDGLLLQAGGGVLLLDEVHHLSKAVQAKLNRAIATDNNGNFLIRRMGAQKEEKVKLTLIFASNLPVQELRMRLLPDFFDRICQYVIEIPPLRDTRDDLSADWESVWDRMRFTSPCPVDAKLLHWLRSQPLYGNYRDLEKIAINYQDFLVMDEEIRRDLGADNAFEYARQQFERYMAPGEGPQNEHPYFALSRTMAEMEAHFQKDLVIWAKSAYGSYQKAAYALSCTINTLKNWENK